VVGVRSATGLLVLALVACPVAPAAAHDETLEGTLQGVHADYFDKGTSTTDWELHTGSRTIPILPTSLPALAPDGAVDVKDEDSGQAVAGPVTSAAPVATPPLGAHKTAVIAFNFTTDTRQPWTTAQVQQKIFSAPDSTSAFFQEESYGQLWLTGDVYGWYTLPGPTTGCNYTTWASLAKTAAAANGFNAANYDHVIYLFPAQSSCGWAGLAYMPGKDSWVNGELSVRVTAHELGHNLGLNHAGSWDCTNGSGAPVTISSSCSLNEYNDPFDAMGAYVTPRHNHGWNLQRLGLLRPSNVETVTASGTYSISSALAPTSAPTTLRIPRTYGSGGAVQDWYYLEVRQSGGVFDNFSLSDWAVRGVSIRVDANPDQTVQSRLLDMHPGGSIADAPLLPGETFEDGQTSVTTVSAGNGAASVDIALPGQPYDVQPPTIPTGLSYVLSGRDVRLAWSASSDNKGVQSYLVYRDAVQVGSASATSYDDTGLAPGQHVYTVYALDASGNRSGASQPLVVTVPGSVTARAARRDHTGPRVRLARHRLRRERLLISARASDVDGVAKVELWIDGRRRSAKRASRLSFRWHMHRGRHRLVVKAADRLGNVSRLERGLRVQR
jgi:M6 family metalloprotease-like protein